MRATKWNCSVKGFCRVAFDRLKGLTGTPLPLGEGGGAGGEGHGSGGQSVVVPPQVSRLAPHPNPLPEAQRERGLAGGKMVLSCSYLKTKTRPGKCPALLEFSRYGYGYSALGCTSSMKLPLSATGRSGIQRRPDTHFVSAGTCG